MLNTFEKNSEQQQRRLERERQMAKMEAAASADLIPPDFYEDIFAPPSNEEQPKINVGASVHSDNSNEYHSVYDKSNSQQSDVSAPNLLWGEDYTKNMQTNGADNAYENIGSMFGRKHRKYLALIMVAVLVIVLSVVLSNRDSSPSSLASSTNKDHDGFQPTVKDVYDATRFEQIKDRILEERISHASEVEVRSSPQYRAIFWLANEDEMTLKPEDEFLPQRYALAVFWYATYVATKMDQKGDDGMVVEGSENGNEGSATNEDRMDDISSLSANVEWNDYTNWLSGKGICSWYGVECHHKEMMVDGNEEELESVSIYNDNNYVTKLNLTLNNVKGIIPNELNVLRDLRVLDLGGNSFRGTIPEMIGELEFLEDLVLSGNFLDGTIPTTFGSLTNIQNLYMSDNALFGTIPSEIGNLVHLRGLGMFENYLNGNIPTELGRLKNLIALYLDINRFSGQIPKEIGSLSSIADIRLRRNNFDGTIPTEIGNLEFVEIIYLDSNAIGGTIPTAISRLKHLDEIHLYKNKLTGSLPSELGVLHNLAHIYLDSNQLTGSIPPEWSGLEDLQQLYLYNNLLTGSLPTEIGNLEDLENFQVYDNDMTGTLPSEIGQMFKLEYFYMENNNISGFIPSEFEKLTKLQAFHVQGNNITGSISDGVCNLVYTFFLTEFVADCAGSEPELACNCCTQCWEWD